jgi:thiamine-monophosphate kinase
MPTSEQDFLAAIDRHFPTQAEGVLLGRGDDCAVLQAEESFCISTDLFVENIHFRRSYFTPADIGHKALAAAASDLAAMSAAPAGFALSLVLPPDGPGGVDDMFLDEMLAGMAALAARLGLPLVGGDLSRGPALILDLVVLGRPASPEDWLVPRGRADVGDAIMLTGEIGLARAGLLALEESGRAAIERWPAATAAHLRPRPRIGEGALFRDLRGTRSLMDVSDGLVRDLPRLIGHKSGLGVDLELSEQMLHPEVREFFTLRGENPLEQAVLGGEDYALAAVARPGDEDEFRLTSSRIIGRVSAHPGLRLNGRPFAVQGFDHFTLGEAARSKAAQPVAQPGTRPAEIDTALTILGHVRSSLTDRDSAPKSGDEGAPEAWLELDPAYAPALLGLEVGSRILVVTWLHQGDRSTLQCHPRADKARPLRGVFATRSPDRPNPMGLHEVTLLEIAHPARLRVFPLEAIDGTPVVDVKSVG